MSELVSVSDAMGAAQSLILELKAPPPFHSVWVQQAISDEGRATGDHHICVSIRPGHEALIEVPETHNGVRIVAVSWPGEAT